MTETRAQRWRVQWATHAPIEIVELCEPMNEIEARSEIRGLMSGGDARRKGGASTLRMWPILESSQLGGRCVVCGMLVRVHSRTAPQFAKCYR